MLNVEKAVLDNSAEGVSEAGDKDLFSEQMDGEILSGPHAADDSCAYEAVILFHPSGDPFHFLDIQIEVSEYVIQSKD